jgi:hypothetical protein
VVQSELQESAGWFICNERRRKKKKKKERMFW